MQPVHDSIRAHLAAPEQPPENLRGWGMRATMARKSSFRLSTVLRSTAMGGAPMAAGQTFTPDEDAITFVNLRALNLSDPRAEVHWMAVYDPAFLVPNPDEPSELPANQKPPDALVTRTVWWVRRGHYKLRSDDVQVAQMLLARPHTLADIAELPFEAKRMWFRNELDQRTSTGVVNIMVTRASLSLSIKLAFRDLLEHSPDASSILSRKFMYAIKDETEFFQDVGGVTREIYESAFKELFSEDRGLFMLSADEDTYVINPTRKSANEDMEEFYFIGLLMGKLLLDGLLLPAHLSLVLRKRLLESPIKFQDLQGVDIELYNSLNWMKDNSITDIVYETFSVENEQGDVVELKPGGSAIDVTDENKIEYIQLKTRHALVSTALEETAAIREGLYDVIPSKLLSVFDPFELEFLLCGLGDIDAMDWQQNSVYKNCNAQSPQIIWFWNAVHQMNNIDRCKLLQFCTGCANLPVEGFRGLRSARGVSRLFQISMITNASNRLPQAHTCFNTLDLPDYETEAILVSKVRQAFEEGAEGFFVKE